MLPIKVFQIDYQDFGNLVWNHFELIENYQTENHIKFHGVVAKLRNGTIPGAIIANHFFLPMGVLNAPRQTKYDNYELFLPNELTIKMQNEKINLLYIDAICGTGETLKEIKNFFTNNYSNKINLYTYSTLVDNKAKTKPDICGLNHSNYFQPPWEWRSFTPQTHLDRLATNDIKSSEENYYALGFSSNSCKSIFEQSLGKKIIGEWIEIFDQESLINHLLSSSKVSNIESSFENLTIELCKTKFLPLINEKTKFIQTNGLTHFIENDLAQAIVLAEKSPICQIILFDGKNLIKINSKTIKQENLISLKF